MTIQLCQMPRLWGQIAVTDHLIERCEGTPDVPARTKHGAESLTDLLERAGVYMVDRHSRKENGFFLVAWSVLDGGPLVVPCYVSQSTRAVVAVTVLGAMEWITRRQLSAGMISREIRERAKALGRRWSQVHGGAFDVCA